MVTLAQTYYQWKVIGTLEDETEPRLLVPWADPNEHEFPFDFMFTTVKEALDALVGWSAFDEAKEENWMLVVVSETPAMQFSEIGESLTAEYAEKNRIEQEG